MRIWFFAAIFGIIGFAAPMIYGYINGFPVPHAQDELSYTVAADTYANGRITNPTPHNFESFETPHVLVEPSYISKYPPMQGVFMATGQVLFGHQIFGVWLSCGLVAMALFWMLSVWTRFNWACIGTSLMIAFIGIDSYWAQSYWGGMIATAGGALFLGGSRQLFKQISAKATVLMTIGGIILVNSRPFEGTVTMLPMLFILAVWLLRDKTNDIFSKFTRIVLPGIIIAGIGLSAMCYQYYRVTGNAFTLPYSVHHKQYYPAPLFIFQSVNESAKRGNERIRKTYETYTSPQILKDFIKIDSLPDSIYLSPFYGMFYLVVAIPFFLISPILSLLLYASLPLLLRRSKWLLLITATIFFTFACMCLGIWWDQYHYTAPLTSCFFLLITEALRQFYIVGKKEKKKIITVAMLVGLIISSFIYLQMFSGSLIQMKDDFSSEKSLITSQLSVNKPVTVKIPTRATFFKKEFEEIIEKLPGKYTAIINYDSAYDMHDEIVYNKADIENAKLIWAHDLGAEKNKSLTDYYKDRKIVFIKLSGSQIEIIPK